MITFLKGVLAESLPDRAIIDVAGVGYECSIPTSTFDALPEEGQKVHLLTHHHVREQEQALFGFATTEERDLFRLLIDRVSGIGPKMGLAVLSGMKVADFKNFVVNADVTALSKIKGVGRKTAERIVVELKDKVGVTAAWQEARQRPSLPKGQVLANDVILALINLGYKQVEAQKAVKLALEALPAGGEAESSTLLRTALRSLTL
jgi:Holliday junction DNA helicase RuvA